MTVYGPGDLMDDYARLAATAPTLTPRKDTQ